MKARHLVSIAELDVQDVLEILALTAKVKTRPEQYHSSLRGKTLGMIFQKASTRTRVSFEVGIYQLGGLGLYLSANDLQLGRGETIPDTARVLSRYVAGLMARTYSHKDVEDLAAHADVPVINGLSDLLHPCQALCDYFTIQEKFGRLKQIRVAYVGDGNNVAHSLINGAAKLGVRLVIGTPPQLKPDLQILESAREVARQTGATIDVLEDPLEAARGAHVVYTDVWASMGQEAERSARLEILRPYQVNAELMRQASSDAIFMHCLPAHRGEEVTDEVADSPASVIFDQAENRLHVQKALMLLLMGGT